MARPKNGPAHAVKKTTALDALRRGESIHAVHKRTKIARDTLRTWKREAGIVDGPAPAPAAAVSVNGKPVAATMEPAAPAAAGAASDALAAALAAGRAAAGEEPAPEGAAAEGGAGEGGPAAAADLPPPGVRLMMLTESLLGMAVRTVAVANKVHWERVEKMATLSADEKAALAPWAPFAEPYVDWIIARMPMIGAGLFGVTLTLQLAGRISQIRQMAPPQEEEKQPEPEPPPRPRESKPEEVFAPGYPSPPARRPA